MRFWNAVLTFLTLIGCSGFGAGSIVPEITNLATTITDSLTANNKKIVAVADFTDLEGNVNILGRFIAEEVSIQLASSGKNISIIDRNQLKRLLAEKNISTTGVIDPNLSKQIGDISGAEAILTGSAYPTGGSLYVSVKIIDVATARIFAGASITVARNEVIDELIKTSFKIPETTRQAQKPTFSPQVKEASNFIFILEEVTMDGNTMNLGFTVKNSFKEPRYLTVNTIKGIDDTGRIYYPSGFSIGQNRARIGDEGKIMSANSENFDVYLTEYQQIKAKLTIRNISTKASVIGTLEMTVAPVNIMDKQTTFIRLEDDLSTIQFTNIPVLRNKDDSSFGN